MCDGTLSSFPRQGATAPWRVRHNYPLDLLMFKYGPVDDEIEFSGRSAKADSAPRPLTPNGLSP